MLFFQLLWQEHWRLIEWSLLAICLISGITFFFLITRPEKIDFEEDFEEEDFE